MGITVLAMWASCAPSSSAAWAWVFCTFLIGYSSPLGVSPWETGATRFGLGTPTFPVRVFSSLGVLHFPHRLLFTFGVGCVGLEPHWPFGLCGEIPQSFVRDRRIGRPGHTSLVCGGLRPEAPSGLARELLCRCVLWPFSCCFRVRACPAWAHELPSSPSRTLSALSFQQVPCASAFFAIQYRTKLFRY